MLSRRVWPGILLVLLLAVFVLGLLQLITVTTRLHSPQDGSSFATSQASPRNTPTSPPLRGDFLTPTALTNPQQVPRSPVLNPNLSNHIESDISASQSGLAVSTPIRGDLLEIPNSPLPTRQGDIDQNVQPSTVSSPTVRDSVENDVSLPLRNITPSPPEPGEPRQIPIFPLPTKQSAAK